MEMASPNGWSFLYGTDGEAPDTDGDGLSDALKFFLDGDPLGTATSATAQELVLEILTPLSQLR